MHQTVLNCDVILPEFVHCLRTNLQTTELLSAISAVNERAAFTAAATNVIGIHSLYSTMST